MRKISVIILIILVAMSGCVGNSTDAQDTVKDTSGATVVYLDNSSFHPETAKVSRGETVMWINNDTAASVIKGNAFQSGTLRRGDCYSYTFNTSGTFNYQLLSHPWTRGGVVIVE